MKSTFTVGSWIKQLKQKYPKKQVIRGVGYPWQIGSANAQSVPVVKAGGIDLVCRLHVVEGEIGLLAVIAGERGQRCVGVRSADRDCVVGVGGCANHQDPDLTGYKVGISCESLSVGGSKCLKIY